ncbi:MAG: hypothetical protein PHV51_08590 [Methanosarcinaceae archaeon]|nr:hypothetical protein [Methanosarcinaceae archaeon]MDD4498187.1 hypothetical protein [Methanosarcinaceae archaeon]
MDTSKTSRRMNAKTEYDNAWSVAQNPGSEPAQDPDYTAEKDHSGYQENMLLIFLALLQFSPILFPVVYQRELFHIFIILSVAAMYYDAHNIRAGSNFEKETLRGNIAAWRPISWGAVTFLGGAIIMAIYLFHRKEIYHANN